MKMRFLILFFIGMLYLLLTLNVREGATSGKNKDSKGKKKSSSSTTSKGTDSTTTDSTTTDSTTDSTTMDSTTTDSSNMNSTGDDIEDPEQETENPFEEDVE